jgi:hypothetical protein
MSVYKIIFAKKTVVGCHPVNEKVEMSGSYFCEHRNGEPIYALVKAESEIEAYDKARVIIAEITERIFGNDFLL